MPTLSHPDQANPPQENAGIHLRRAVDASANGTEPRHLKLREAILEVLAKGIWAPGDKLPSETELARISGLSLGTTQKALTHLARDGVLVRRHGHGTFVAGDASQSQQLMHFRFVGDDGAAIMPVYAEAIERRVVTKRGPWSDFLTYTKNFIRIRRRVNVAGEFDCMSELYIDADRFKPILDLPMQELHRVIIRNVLATRYNAPTFQATQRIYATRFGEAVSKVLNLDPEHAFGMVLEVRSFTHHQAPLAFQNIFIPPDVRTLELPDTRVYK